MINIDQETLAQLERYPEVLRFAKAMLHKLIKNEHKHNGWKHYDARGRYWRDPEQKHFLVDKLKEERAEFNEELARRPYTDNLLLEAADEANILMMICDNANRLK